MIDFQSWLGNTHITWVAIMTLIISHFPHTKKEIKRCPLLNLLFGKLIFADVVKLRISKLGDHPLLLEWAPNPMTVLTKERQKEI